MPKVLIASLALAFAIATPARAEWRRADSEHFVVYADDGERDLARFTEMLERYHAAMALITGSDTEVPSPSNRVTIFAVGSERKVSKLAGGSKYVAGFYIPRAGGSRAFVPDVRAGNGDPDFSLITLMHEYAHHFLIGSARFAMPQWMNEGAAEFFSSARFPSKGGIEIGLPAYHRAYDLRDAKEVPIRELLDRDEALPDPQGGKDVYDAFYGRSWALYHYLVFDAERKGQLVAYARAVAAGKSSLDAAREVFGDLDRLDRELDNYVDQSRMSGFVLSPEALETGPVAVAPVSEGMGEMMPVIIRSQRGVDAQEAADLVVEARAIAARWPDDGEVHAALAEAEFDAGNDDAAIAAADRAIGADPAVKNAYVQKGYALFRKAENAPPEDARAAFSAALVPFSALNKLETDHPLPLIYYYRSFVERGEAPSENARHALERASMLAPFDHALAMSAALMQAGEGKIALARHNLAPLAVDPHGGALARAAQRFIELLADAPEGTAWSPPPGTDIADVPDVAAAE